ncbi:hypothetical protein AB6A40_006240, partial [Gnathostoma spinigerum]
GPDGKPLPTNAEGEILGPDGEAIPTNAEGVPVDSRGEPLPTDLSGVFVKSSTGMGVVSMPDRGLYAVPKCELRTSSLDIVFAVDASLLIKMYSFFVDSLVRSSFEYLDLSPDVNRLGVVFFDDIAEIPVALGGYNDRENIHFLLREYEVYHSSVEADVVIGIRAVKQQFDSFGRKDAAQLLVLICGAESRNFETWKTTGYPTIPVLIDETTEFPAQQTEPETLIFNKITDDVFKQVFIRAQDQCKRGHWLFPPLTITEQIDVQQHSTIKQPSTVPEKVLPTDVLGRPVRPVIGPDGKPLPTNAEGEILGPDGEAIPTNAEGVPVDSRGEPLPTDTSGNVIYPAKGLDEEPLPTDIHGRQIYPVVGPDGQVLPTSADGAVLGPDGKPLPTNAAGTPIDARGEPLPTDEAGNVVYQPSTMPEQVLPTDVLGRPVRPVIGPDGKPLPTNAEGEILGPDGEAIPTNAEGVPVDSRGEPLPTDTSGNVIYPAKGLDEEPLPTDIHGRQIYPVVGPDGQVLPTSADGAVLGPDGKPLPTNAAGTPIDARGEPLPTDEAGNVVYQPSTMPEQVLPTDVLGRPVRPVIGPDGKPLPTNAEGEILGPDGEAIPTNAEGVPVDSRGEPLPTDTSGNVIYPTKEPSVDYFPSFPAGGFPVIVGSEYNVSSLHGVAGASIEPSVSTRPLGVTDLEECTVDAHLDLLLVFDTSNNVKVVDYRMMKDFVEGFILQRFNLHRHRVRVGVLKYGDSVDVPIALGEYFSPAELVSRISDVRRIRGVPFLGRALRDVAGEFLVSSSSDASKVVIVFSSGKSSDDPRDAAKILLEEVKAIVYLVAAGDKHDKSQNMMVVGKNNPHRILELKQWRRADPKSIGAIADELCQILPRPEDETKQQTWPIRKYTPGQRTTPVHLCRRIDYQADVVFLLDSSDNFSPEEYRNIKESVSTIIEESFDLAHDVVRVGIIEYSDKASVPVPLGYYEDKSHLLLRIDDSEQLRGPPIILKALDAAREQFVSHGRSDVPRVIVLVSNGVTRGNPANAAEDLRNRYNVEIFALAVDKNPNGFAVLERLVGEENALDRVIRISDVSKLSNAEIRFTGKVLCGNVEPASAAATIVPITIGQNERKTTKRDTKYVETNLQGQKERLSTFYPASRTTRSFDSMPLCKDGFLRPYQLTFVIDATARSPQKDFRFVLSFISDFLEKRFSPQSGRMRVNLVVVDSNGVKLKNADLAVTEVGKRLSHIEQNTTDEMSPKLGLGIDESITLATEHAVKGVYQLIILISSDGTSSDDALPSARFAVEHYGLNIIAVSIRSPSSELLKDLAGGVPTRVIHFSDWMDGSDLFGSWLGHEICGYVTAPTTRKASTTRTTHKPLRKTTSIDIETEPTNVKVTAVSPTSLSVSWTCCTNNRADYIVFYTPDASLPKSAWKKVHAKCRDSFGRIIYDLPSDTEYTVCVQTSHSASNNSIKLDLANCDSASLDKDTSPPPDYEQVEQTAASCRCVCDDNGLPVIKPSCDMKFDPFRPISTLPPAEDGECDCRVMAHGGRCPRGYFLIKGLCYDINECQQQNGGCSHGCVNTPGDYYCACPHGMMRDPVDPKTCISTASSFDKIAALLGQYLHANQPAVMKDISVSEANNDIGKKKPVKYKATVRSSDDKTISFEWSAMPTMVKRALKWLF